jgi:restriction system protein
MGKAVKKLEIVHDEKLPLEDWLRLVLNPNSKKKYAFHFWQFPSDKQLDEYLASLHTRSDAEVKRLLRCFLIPTGSLGADSKLLEYWRDTEELDEMLTNSEFGRRLLQGKPWEGNTWILDLLPEWPQSALDALNAYLLAHAAYLPEGRLWGLSDVSSIIRHKYLLAISPKDVLRTVSPRDFEYLIAALFRKLGYEANVTQQSRDGGADIVCWKRDGMVTESMLIECKHRSGRVGADVVRQLAGAVSELGASKGVIVTSGSFTVPAVRFANQTGRIQLIDFDRLNVEMNTHLDTRWTDQLPQIIATEQKCQATKTPILVGASGKVTEIILKVANPF